MYLVIDLGGTFMKYVIMNREGEFLEKGKKKSPNSPGDTPMDLAEAMGEIYDQYKDKYELEGIAVSLPGQIDVERGIVYGGGAFGYMNDVNYGEILSARCNNLPIAMENDGKCAALAEIWLGNAKDAQNAVILVFGTGIGGGIVKDRKIHRGNRLIAGEVSFLIDQVEFKDVDNVKCIEDFETMESFLEVPYIWSARASAVGMSVRYAKKAGIPIEEASGELLYRKATEGDSLAIETLEETYFSIAKQCLNFYVTYDPDVILIGGGISAEPRFVEGIKRYVKKLQKISRIYLDIKIDTCKFRNDSNLYGAMFNFMQKYDLH